MLLRVESIRKLAEFLKQSLYVCLCLVKCGREGSLWKECGWANKEDYWDIEKMTFLMQSYTINRTKFTNLKSSKSECCEEV